MLVEDASWHIWDNNNWNRCQIINFVDHCSCSGSMLSTTLRPHFLPSVFQPIRTQSLARNTLSSLESTWHQSASELLHPTSSQCRTVCDSRLSLNYFRWRLKTSFQTVMNTTRCWAALSYRARRYDSAICCSNNVQKWIVPSCSVT